MFSTKLRGNGWLALRRKAYGLRPRHVGFASVLSFKLGTQLPLALNDLENDQQRCFV